MTSSFRPKHSIVNVLTLYAILLVVLALVVASLATFIVSYDTQRNEVLRGLEKTAQQAALGISSHLSQAIGVLDIFAKTQDLVSAEPMEQTTVLGKLLTHQRGFFSELVILDAAGQEQAKVSPFRIFPASELVNQANSPEFQTALAGNVYVGPIRISEQSNVPVTTIGVPIKLPNGQFGGVLVAEVTLKQMWDIVSEVEFGESGYVYVVDKAGRLRAFGELTEVYQLFGHDLTHLPEVAHFVAGIPWSLDQQHEYVGLRQTDVIGSYATIHEADWGVVVELPTSEAFSGLRRMMLSLFGVLLSVTVIAAVVSPLLLRKLRVDLELLQQGAAALGRGDLERRIVLKRQDELGVLAQIFNNMADQLRDLVAGLEQRVAERTRDLERRSVQIQTSAEVGAAAASMRDLDQLLSQVTHLISERFGFYHVGIFLLDATGEYAILRAANSEAGQRMLAHGHRLQVGQEGIVGYVTKMRQPRIVLDVGDDAMFFDNPDLPNTRSEMALPLIVGDQLLGVLDVQSTEPEAFIEDDIAALRVLADQIAIAIENARLFTASQQALSSARRAYDEFSRKDWLQLLRRQSASYVSRATDTRMTESHWRPEMIQASQEGQTVHAEGGDVVAPIKSRDLVVGVVRLSKSTGEGEWTAEEIQMIEALSDQLGQALESARLYQDTQRRAAQEQLLGEVTGRMRETLDVETVLETAVDEIRRALRLDRAAVRLVIPETEGDLPAGERGR